MSKMPLLIDTGLAAGIAFILTCAILLFLLLRNRVRCPKDGTSMDLVRPDQGKHMVFRCKKCGHTRRTRISVGRR